MVCDILPKDIPDLQSTDILPQTAYWAEIKHHQGYIPTGFEIKIPKDLLQPSSYPSNTESAIREDILVLIKYLNNHQCLAYVPYGPKLEPHKENYGVVLEELSEALRQHLPANCVAIRYDLPWQNIWSIEDAYFDENGQWIGPPSLNSQEFRLNIKTQNWNLFKSPSDILPSNTFFLDLKQTPEEIQRNMKNKTRYNINLANRKGVRVREFGEDYIDIWYNLYRETCHRNKISLHPIENFITLMQKEPEAKNIDVSLLMADHDGDFLAAMFLIRSQKRGTYLYGASSSYKSNLMATYAVQWEALKLSKKRGCTEYDMFGCAPNGNRSHPMHGLYRYKSGFGGKLYHRMGCWDYPLDQDAYLLTKAFEVKNQGYHLS